MKLPMQSSFTMDRNSLSFAIYVEKMIETTTSLSASTVTSKSLTTSASASQRYLTPNGIVLGAPEKFSRGKEKTIFAETYSNREKTQYLKGRSNSPHDLKRIRQMKSALKSTRMRQPIMKRRRKTD